MKGFDILYKKIKRYLKKIFFKNFRSNFWKIRYLHTNSCSSLIINSRIVICISDERAWHPLQENEAIFSKNIFFNCRRNFRKITFLLTTSVLLAVKGYFAYQVKGIDVLYKKIKCYFRKKRISKNLDGNFEKNTFCLLILRYSW